MKLYRLLPFVLVALACTIFGPAEPPLTIETLRAQATASPFTTRLPTIPFATLAYPTFGATLASPTDLVPASATSTVIPADAPGGRIVYTCQVGDAADFLCLINADGTGFVQLTTDTNKHWFPSLAPDGGSVVYSAYVKNNIYEIYEMNLASGRVTQLTDELGILKAPEISPDGKWIIFNRGTPDGKEQIWIMERDGNSAHKLYDRGWDPTWSPDGSQILFASDKDGSNQLYVINRDGSGLRRLTKLNAIRGRSDWSPDGKWIVTYSGESWARELLIFRADGSDLRQLSPAGGNSQGPSFSPDGKWVAFTAYFDHFNDDLGCEIYIIRIDGTGLRRLTDNSYCDYQPRWGQ